MNFLTPAHLTLAFLLLLVLIWFTRRPMTARVRRAAPGAFARISHGVIHYEWHGPKNGPVLVMIHGLTTPSFIWRDQLPTLTSAGFRVLTFDHFGRGFSDRPVARHDMAFFVQEIDELLAELDVKAGFNLLGYSMGGGIATHYATVRRDRINKLVLVAPVGFLTNRPGWIARWPVVGDLAMFLFGGWSLRRTSRKDGIAENVDDEMIARQCQETRYAGFGAAVLSSVRNVIYIDQSKEHRLLLDRKVPLLAIFGTADKSIPIQAAMRLREINRQAQIVEIEDAGHALVLTHKDQVNQALIDFLS